MSNIYIQEPPTYGKVLLNTTVGDIEIELWTKEAPKACRNFIQLCMEGYYDETIFHRLVKEFIVQGGDPTGTGEGGESIYGKPFKDELHSRLRFVRRGLVAMANSGPNDNGSQFFFTLATTPELMNKHTIFGKVVGDTLYNMLKLSEGEVDRDEKPLYPHKINSTKVLTNPYDDIVPRVIKKKERSSEGRKPKSKSKATKNFKLLSFGEEAEEEEQEAIEAAETLRHKGKSSHDLLNDAKLSSLPAVEDATPLSEDLSSDKRKASGSEDEDEEDDQEAMKLRIKKKFKEGGMTGPVKVKDDSLTLNIKGKKSIDDLREEVRALKKDLTEAKKRKERRDEEDKTQKEPSPAPEDIVIPEHDPMASFHAQQQKYRKQKGKKAKGKGSKREIDTLDMLQKFKTRLSAAQRLSAYEDDAADAEEAGEVEEEDDVNDMSWMSHKLEFEEKNQRVLDANVADNERYEIFDPRNPLNVRRRGGEKADRQRKGEKRQ
ncbi:hypothetical protein CAPTEDRAFT_161676 [Capitella teleta]|uniref:Spliceosome-associated protein CWC27 homolog n=1 Tax=Capitella teleta TaxID=283909 RepID=N1PB22_CAPTE|nr:hypothetical protein CAPTEDRAFT_161676 [Capitella teleta]|eukprot:ELU18908.1 hypothetical protein CAPTEDRAFT_161676 [Capitella teleta]